jgi:hypothetical protein
MNYSKPSPQNPTQMTPLYGAPIDPKQEALKALRASGISLRESHINTTRQGRTSPRIMNQRGGGIGNQSEAFSGYPDPNDLMFLMKLRGQI